MGRFFLAFRSFFATLFDGKKAEAVRLVLDQAALPPQAAPVASDKTAVEKPAPPQKGGALLSRSDALTLLAALQREGRLIDFLKEPIAGYTDAQIGGAVREVHAGCAAVIERMFGIETIREEAEGTTIEVTQGYDASRMRLSGNSSAPLPVRGKLRHAGWQAKRCEIPTYTGEKGAAQVLAPAEIDIS